MRQGPRYRTEMGFLSSPVLGHLTDKQTGPLEIIAAGEDRRQTNQGKWLGWCKLGSRSYR